MSPDGLRFTAHTPLVQRALDAVAREPIGTPELARAVFGLRQAPPGLASRLVFDLLGEDGRFRVDPQGVWRLADPEPADDRQTLADTKFAVVDVETTGSSVARGARIVEFSAVLVEAGEVKGEYTTLVNPDEWIPRWVTRLTGIEMDMVRDAPRFRDIAGRVRQALEGRVFVAHNVGFDWRFVAEELRMANSVMPDGPKLCTVRLARRVLPGLRRRGLDSLSRYYDVEIVNRHRAGDDARATATILLRMLEAADRQGILYWDELEDWVSGRPRVRIPPARPGEELSA
ncbi:MAG: exonuclease domain-containing protein [marine benthic group bacterium]|jgi:DNA polymerase-3 subunit epsilon|nr:exonuclease domain-containing protein [Candidatus Benthicola marisminoris]